MAAAAMAAVAMEAAAAGWRQRHRGAGSAVMHPRLRHTGRALQSGRGGEERVDNVLSMCARKRAETSAWEARRCAATLAICARFASLTRSVSSCSQPNVPRWRPRGWCARDIRSMREGTTGCNEGALRVCCSSSKQGSFHNIFRCVVRASPSINILRAPRE